MGDGWLEIVPVLGWRSLPSDQNPAMCWRHLVLRFCQSAIQLEERFEEVAAVARLFGWRLRVPGGLENVGLGVGATPEANSISWRADSRSVSVVNHCARLVKTSAIAVGTKNFES
ncbi:MAG: hypothetical protein D6728_20835 [Cyanobacteria bacterium J055]|nr:MAG: hypothetical protein D6728_20835 [Cyanobacteria bacterium J055]